MGVVFETVCLKLHTLYQELLTFNNFPSELTNLMCQNRDTLCCF